MLYGRDDELSVIWAKLRSQRGSPATLREAEKVLLQRLAPPGRKTRRLTW